MQQALENAVIVLIILLVAYVLAELIIKSYFAAKIQYVNYMIEKAKELKRNGETRQEG